MARVEIATQGWGVIVDGYFNPMASQAVTLTNLDDSAAAVYAARTGGSTISLVSDGYGVLPGFVEEGTYKLAEPNGPTRYVEAVVGENAVRRDRQFVNVKDYGAVGDGVTNDNAAVTAAIATATAAGGGTVFFPRGTYLCNTLDVATVNWVTGDNITFLGEGKGASKIKTTTAGSVFAVHGGIKAGTPGTIGNYSPENTAYYNLTGAVIEGAQSVTCATAAEAGSFAVGDWVFIRTGYASWVSSYGYPDSELNQVTAVDGGTGVVTLRWPTAKPYAQENFITGSSGISAVGGAGDAVPYGIAKMTDRLLHNITFRNLTLENAGTTRGIFNGSSVVGFTIDNCELITNLYVTSLGALKNARWQNCEVRHTGATDWVWSFATAYGCCDVLIQNNFVVSTKQQTVLHLHEGTARWTVRDNVFVNPVTAVGTTWPHAASIKARSYRGNLVGNTFVNSHWESAIGVDEYGSGGGIIRDNTIIRGPAASIIIRAPNWLVQDNRMPGTQLVEVTPQQPSPCQALTAWVTVADQNPTLGVLPAHTMVTNVYVYVNQAFNSDGTDLLRVGLDAADNRYATDVDVSTTGAKTVTLGTHGRGYTASGTVVEAYYNNSGSEPTTGKALVVLEFYRLPLLPT